MPRRNEPLMKICHYDCDPVPSYVLAALIMATIFGISCSSKTKMQPDAQHKYVVPGIDVNQTSDDPTFGRVLDNPIMVGGPKGFSGPESEQLYLRHLRDKAFRPIKFVRIGS